MTRRPPIAIALAAAALTACSSEPDEAAPMENMAENVVVMDETPTENFVMPEETPSPTPSPTPIVEQDIDTQEQVQEDADAVGMTARLPRQDGNDTAPAE